MVGFLEDATDGRARAVLSVHLNGQCADPAGLQQVAARHGLIVIEDACHALGTTYWASESEGDGARHPVGACHHADMACFSFHPVKTIAMGEGGAVSTKDPQIAERLARLRNHGIVRDPAAFLNKSEGLDIRGAATPWYYEMHELGFNYRASDIHCALGSSQLKKLEDFVAKRRSLARHYEEHLAPLPPAVRPVPRVPGCDAAWHLFAVLVDFAAAGTTRAALMDRLRAQGIGTQVHYIPVPWQPYYRNRYPGGDYPGAAAYYDKVLSLPLFTAMSQEDVERVTAALSATLGISA